MAVVPLHKKVKCTGSISGRHWFYAQIARKSIS